MPRQVVVVSLPRCLNFVAVARFLAESMPLSSLSWQVYKKEQEKEEEPQIDISLLARRGTIGINSTAGMFG